MEFPSKCPYCGKDNIPNRIDRATDRQENIIELHKCIHCAEPIFLIKKLDLTQNEPFDTEIISYYPLIQHVDFPERIKELSPAAYKAFEQTLNAKEQGFDMLIGARLRIALEWLVWDYLIKVKNFSKPDIEKLKLYQRIEKMSCNFYTEVCTRLIRKFGNDSVHIIKQIDFSVEEVIDMFVLLCSLIDSELQINEVHERLS